MSLNVIAVVVMAVAALVIVRLVTAVGPVEDVETDDDYYRRKP